MSNRDLCAAVPAPLRARVRLAIERTFPGVQPESLSPLAGGLSGAQLLKLEVGGRAYVLRTQGAAPAFGDPQRQYACLAIAARRDVTPAVHYADAETRTIISDYVEPAFERSMPGSSDDFPQRLAWLLRRLHDGPDFPPFLDAFGFIHGGLETLARAQYALPAGVRRFFAEFEAVERGLRPHLLTRPCHNDINPGNVLAGNGRLWLIDWETACAGDPYLDLASAIHWFELGPEQEAGFLDAYFDDGPSARQLAKLRLIKQVSWCFYGLVFLLRSLQEGLGAAPEDGPLPPFPEAYRAVKAGTMALNDAQSAARFGLVHFEQALWAMAQPEQESALAQLAR